MNVFVKRCGLLSVGLILNVLLIAQQVPNAQIQFVTEDYTTGPDTISVAQALAIGAELEAGMLTDEVYVIRGYVSSARSAYSEAYQNQSFYVTDDSTSFASSMADGAFYVYRGKPSTQAAVGEGAFVEFTCAIMNYNGQTIENADQNIVVTVLRDAPSCRIVEGQCGDSITWTWSCDGYLHLTGSGPTYDYATRPEAPFRGMDVTSVTIDEGISYLGRFSFYGCTMPTVTIPSSVTLISYTAFNACRNLTAIDVDVNNTVYGSIGGVLSDKNGTTLLRFPTGRSGVYAIPTGITVIGQGAFNACYNITEVTIPGSVTTLGPGAFYACIGLTSIELPASVTRIGIEAFAECTTLGSITCNAPTPPVCDSIAFDEVTKDSCILYVPAASVSAYQAAPEWSEFLYIQAITEPCEEMMYKENDTICEGETYTWHRRTLTKPGTYYDTLQTIAGCDSVCVLDLTVNPSYYIEEIVSIREDKLPYHWQNQTITQAGTYVAEYTTVHTGCDSIITLQLMVTALPIYAVNVQADHGHVNGTGTYPEGTRITLSAVPDENFAFQMWSDGTTENPNEFTVRQDTTFRAHFYMPEVEQEVTVDSIETNSVTISWDTVPGATLYELRIYKNGALVVTLQVDANNNIVNTELAGPDRLIARKDSTGGSSETLQVNIGGLEPGQDYTYSLDALDDDRSYVGAQSGSFTTEEEIIEGLDTLFDKQRPKGARKLLIDGHLYIEMPDGTMYSPEGALYKLSNRK